MIAQKSLLRKNGVWVGDRETGRTRPSERRWECRHTGMPLLIVAAAGGQLHVAEELLQRGAVVDLRCYRGGTALISAAMQGHLAMVRLLLKHNASVDLQSDVGHTALKAAKVFG